MHAGGGRPSEELAAFCGRLAVGWLILEPADAESKGALERSHRFVRTNLEPGRRFANELAYGLRSAGALLDSRGQFSTGAEASILNPPGQGASASQEFAHASRPDRTC